MCCISCEYVIYLGAECSGTMVWCTRENMEYIGDMNKAMEYRCKSYRENKEFEV